MPRGGKRTKKDYEKEIEETAKRMQKRPEHLKAAKNDSTWLAFLDSIGVTTIETKQGQSFWGKVKNEIEPSKPTWKEPYTNLVTKQTSYRDKSGKFVKPASIGAPSKAKPVKQEPSSIQLVEAIAYKFTNPKTKQVLYRSGETGKFVSAKDIVEGKF